MNPTFTYATVMELVDMHASGACVLTDVWVQIPPVVV